MNRQIQDDALYNDEEEKKSEREIELEQTIEDLRTSIKWNAIRDIIRWVLILIYAIVVS